MSELLITRATDQEAEVKRLLLKAQNVEQNTALHLAVKHGHYDIVDLLIRNKPGLTSITNKARVDIVDLIIRSIHIHTHTQIYIYIYIYI